MFTTTVRLSDEEKKILDENCISLTKFVRMNLKKYEKSHKPTKVTEILTNEMEVI